MKRTPTLVTLHVWGIESRRIPGSLLRMASQRRKAQTFPGVTFAKLLGTGSGETFTVRDADVHHWALLCCWDAPQAAAAFERSRVVRPWDQVATERLRLELKPLASKGHWSGQEPFGAAASKRYEGPVAALTRARLRAAKAAAFWRSVPPVSAALNESPGLLLSLGIGEAPVGLQGTLSVWDSPRALARFAYEDPRHQEVISRTREVGWYAEELFARFALIDHSGTYRGRSIQLVTKTAPAPPA
jgi:hypothetical protein